MHVLRDGAWIRRHRPAQPAQHGLVLVDGPPTPSSSTVTSVRTARSRSGRARTRHAAGPAATGSPVTDRQQVLAAVLDAIPMHSPVARQLRRLWGVPGIDCSPAHVVRAVGRRGRRSSLAILHQLAGLGPQHVTRARRDPDRAARGRRPAAVRLASTPSGPRARSRTCGVGGSPPGGRCAARSRRPRRLRAERRDCHARAPRRARRRLHPAGEQPRAALRDDPRSGLASGRCGARSTRAATSGSDGSTSVTRTTRSSSRCRASVPLGSGRQAARRAPARRAASCRVRGRRGHRRAGLASTPTRSWRAVRAARRRLTGPRRDPVVDFPAVSVAPAPETAGKSCGIPRHGGGRVGQAMSTTRP